jgi:hypothetical protein
MIVQLENKAGGWRRGHFRLGTLEILLDLTPTFELRTYLTSHMRQLEEDDFQP